MGFASSRSMRFLLVWSWIDRLRKPFHVRYRIAAANLSFQKLVDYLLSTSLSCLYLLRTLPFQPICLYRVRHVSRLLLSRTIPGVCRISVLLLCFPYLVILFDPVYSGTLTSVPPFLDTAYILENGKIGWVKS